MSRLTPVSRVELIKKFRELGFVGPFTGGRHQFMQREMRRITLANPHKTNISVDLLVRILKQAGISREEWVD